MCRAREAKRHVQDASPLVRTTIAAQWTTEESLAPSLKATDLALLLPDLQAIPLTVKHVCARNAENPSATCGFPTGRLLPHRDDEEGAAVEVATVGDEGMLGMSAFFGGTAMPGESMLQVPSRRPDEMTAERLTVGAFRREINRHGALHDCISR